MKNILVISVFMLLFAYGYAQTSTHSGQSKKPDILFVEKSIDFGTIKEGERPNIVFKFYNSGTAPLLIKDIHAPCGCTGKDWPRHPIMPGDSSSITATFTSRGYAGRNVHKSVRVVTNIPDKKGKKGQGKEITLFFKGHVEPK